MTLGRENLLTISIKTTQSTKKQKIDNNDNKTILLKQRLKGKREKERGEKQKRLKSERRRLGNADFIYYWQKFGNFQENNVK